MKRFLSSGLIVMLVLASGCGHDQTSSEKPAFEMTSDEIVNAFLENDSTSNAKYNDQIIQITGPVMELSKENGMVHGVKLSSDEFNIVNCTFQNPVDAAEIGGESITVKGVCSGFLGDSDSMLPGGTVELKRAALVTTESKH